MSGSTSSRASWTAQRRFGMIGPPRFRDALAVLARHHVDVIVVGGVAAVLDGVPMATFDLDVVHSRSAENLQRLSAALEDLDARYRDPAGRILRPAAADLAGDGHHLLLTRCGPLDVLGAIGRGRRYEDLLPESAPVRLGEMSVPVLRLVALIRTKEEAGRDKDRAVLDLLRKSLRESGDG
jgi:hypothetical protein